MSIQLIENKTAETVVLLNKLLRHYHLEKLIGDPLILQAFYHASFAHENGVESNERLEFLGDAVLELASSTYMYNNYSQMGEGQLTKLRATFVCEEANFTHAKKLKLDQMILLSIGESASTSKRTAIISDCFEAFLGALYLKLGFVETYSFLAADILPLISTYELKPFEDYKSRLQEFVQAEARTDLEYREISISGPPHDRTFNVAVYLGGCKLSVGTGKSKKEAQQKAAKGALDKMATADQLQTKKK